MNEELRAYEKKSKLGLMYQAEGARIVITNALGQRIAELNLQYTNEGIYNDSWFGYVTGEEFKEIMSGAYLDYFSKTRCTKKICNTLSMQGGMDDDTSKWFNNHLFPKLLAAGIAYNALVIPEDVFAQQTIEEFETNLGNKMGRLFPTFDKALEWLKRVN